MSLITGLGNTLSTVGNALKVGVEAVGSFVGDLAGGASVVAAATNSLQKSILAFAAPNAVPLPVQMLEPPQAKAEDKGGFGLLPLLALGLGAFVFLRR